MSTVRGETNLAQIFSFDHSKSSLSRTCRAIQAIGEGKCRSNASSLSVRFSASAVARRSGCAQRVQHALRSSYRYVHHSRCWHSHSFPGAIFCLLFVYWRKIITCCRCWFVSTYLLVKKKGFENLWKIVMSRKSSFLNFSVVKVGLQNKSVYRTCRQI